MQAANPILILLLIPVVMGCVDTKPKGSNLPQQRQRNVDISTFSIDLFQVGATLPVGSDGKTEDAYRARLLESGISISADGAVLTAIYVDLNDFDGEFSLSGKKLPISTHSSLRDIRRTLGEPYWQHKLDDETLYFYESKTGRREVTFTFSVLGRLRFVDISNYPIFVDPKQRERYGVDKPWPPQN
jgi:hypothetical protein